MTLDQLRTANPFPWRQEVVAGQVRLFDANDQEVPLFHITGLAIYTTKSAPPPAEAQPT